MAVTGRLILRHESLVGLLAADQLGVMVGACWQRASSASRCRRRRGATVVSAPLLPVLVHPAKPARRAVLASRSSRSGANHPPASHPAFGQEGYGAAVADEGSDTYGLLARIYTVLRGTAVVLVAVGGLAFGLAQVSSGFADWARKVKFSLLVLTLLIVAVTMVAGFVLLTIAKRLEKQLRRSEQEAVSQQQLAKLASDETAAARSKVTNLEKVVAGLEELAFYDPLTGIPNSNFLARLLRQRQVRSGPRCLVLLDLRDFGSINKVHNHWKGDEYLSRFAAMVTESGRRNEHLVKLRPLVDERVLKEPLDIQAFRKSSGGDEFFILLNGTIIDGLGYLNRLMARAPEFDQMADDVLHAPHPFGFQAGLTAIAPSESYATASKRVMTVLGKAKERSLFSVNWLPYEMPHYSEDSIEAKIVRTAIETFGDPHAASFDVS